MPKMQKYLYGNGGPILMVQVENEYGAFACDREYSIWLRDETTKYVEENAVLFTNDIPEDMQVNCGKIPNVLATLDFEAGKFLDVALCFEFVLYLLFYLQEAVLRLMIIGVCFDATNRMGPS